MAAPIINPAGALALAGKVDQLFTADQVIALWEALGASFAVQTPSSIDWKSPNFTGLYTVRAKNGADEWSAATNINLRGIIPNYWARKTPITAKKEVQIFRPKYGPSQSRGVGLGELIHEWELGNEDSIEERFIELKAFYDYHHPGIQFDMVDPFLQERRTYVVDSDIAYNYNDRGGVSWSFRIKEEYPYVVTPA